MKLIYFSPVSWNSFTQRPHEFVNYFHQTTLAQVVWVEPYATRLPKFSDFFRLGYREKSPNREVPAWLTILSSSCLPVEPVGWLNFLNTWFHSRLLKNIICDSDDFFVIGKPSLLAFYALDKFNPSNSIYDAMDDFPEFYTGISARHMRTIELKISKKISRIIVSSSNLKQKFLDVGMDSLLVLNACSLTRINKFKLENNAKKIRPIVGYIGTIAQWFDWEFVVALANNNGDADFHLIGPVIGALPKNLPANIKIFPPLDHESAMHAMALFSIGIIPFKRNPLTHCVDPIKYYEYKAFGLPTISTDFGEMSYRKNEKGIYVLETVSACLTLDIKKLDRTDFAEVCSWQDRFSVLF